MYISYINSFNVCRIRLSNIHLHNYRFLQSTDVRLDAFCSHVNMSVTSQDIIVLVDAINGIVDVILGSSNVPYTKSTDKNNNNDDNKNNNDHHNDNNNDIVSNNIDINNYNNIPRISILSPLCILNVNFVLDDLNLALLSDSPNDINLIIIEALKKFISISNKRNNKSNIIIYSRELILKRFQKLFIPYFSADSVLNLISKSISKGLNEEETLGKALLFLDEFLSVTPHNINSLNRAHNIHSKSPLFEFALKGLKLHHYRLTYDNKSTLHIKDLLLSDHARFPVFHIEFKKKELDIKENSGHDFFPSSKAAQKKGNHRSTNKHASVRFPASSKYCFSFLLLIFYIFFISCFFIFVFLSSCFLFLEFPSLFTIFVFYYQSFSEFINIFIYSLIYLFIYSFIYLFIYLFIHLFIYLFIY